MDLKTFIPELNLITSIQEIHFQSQILELNLQTYKPDPGTGS